MNVMKDLCVPKIQENYIFIIGDTRVIFTVTFVPDIDLMALFTLYCIS